MQGREYLFPSVAVVAVRCYVMFPGNSKRLCSEVNSRAGVSFLYDAESLVLRFMPGVAVSADGRDSRYYVNEISESLI